MDQEHGEEQQPKGDQAERCQLHAGARGGHYLWPASAHRECR